MVLINDRLQLYNLSQSFKEVTLDYGKSALVSVSQVSSDNALRPLEETTEEEWNFLREKILDKLPASVTASLPVNIDIKTIDWNKAKGFLARLSPEEKQKLAALRDLVLLFHGKSYDPASAPSQKIKDTAQPNRLSYPKYLCVREKDF